MVGCVLTKRANGMGRSTIELLGLADADSTKGSGWTRLTVKCHIR